MQQTQPEIRYVYAEAPKSVKRGIGCGDVLAIVLLALLICGAPWIIDSLSGAIR
jgi:hypothetical protein